MKEYLGEHSNYLELSDLVLAEFFTSDDPDELYKAAVDFSSDIIFSRMNEVADVTSGNRLVIFVLVVEKLRGH